MKLRTIVRGNTGVAGGTKNGAPGAVPPVTESQLHTGFGAANRAAVQCPEDWQTRARELLAAQFTPDVTEAVVARIAALTALLAEGPRHGTYDSPGGAVNVLPELFEAATTCPLAEGRFDPTKIMALKGAK